MRWIIFSAFCMIDWLNSLPPSSTSFLLLGIWSRWWMFR
jgi:hypothetical protein